ncbi:splicing factor SYF1 [Seminavis robusta]|uniref:Splicing factor SYF1 n=1 Tax=Seminavis robusta TaxID=568900 RepID=A0A9N8DGT2_9STRA|nr:splicing factor SYF1 [Seminavis robusta]|eukprot:Sro80_g042990.1 splicing factor SYF1 (1063) ;mRNA; r:36423-39611
MTAAGPSTTRASSLISTNKPLSDSQKRAFATIAEEPALLHHEEIVSHKSPYDLKAWWQYLDDIDSLIQDVSGPALKHKQPPLWHVRNFVGKRSVAALPGSYKLWKHHWEFVLRRYKNSSTDATTTTSSMSAMEVLQCFETALRTLHKFPRVWMEYIQFVLSLPDTVIAVPTMTTTTISNTTGSTSSARMTKTTFLRQLANRALQALPITQHEDKLWPILLECWKDDAELNDFLADDDDDDDDDAVLNNNNTNNDDPLRVETRCRLLKRYGMLQPTFQATLCQEYIQHAKWGEAALLYQHMLQTATPAVQDTPQYYQWWNALADLCTTHPAEVEQAGVPWEAMVRAAVAMDSTTTKTAAATTQSSVLQEMRGLLWSKLADSWIRRGEFDLARSVLEEGMESVSRVRDFTILFDAYLQFEEGLLENLTEQMNDDDDEQEEVAADDQDWDILLGTTNSKKDKDDKPAQSMADLELALARAEHLTARRPILLNRVLLRQNPNNVSEWLNRSQLYVKQKEPIMAVAALEEALKTVHPNKANNGKPNAIVTELVKLYEERSVAKARDLLDRICNQHEYPFAKADELAECVAAWVELELRQEAWDDALSIVRSAVAPVAHRNRNKGGHNNNKSRNLTKSLRLWDLLLDLEESLGTVQSAKDAYNRSFEIKVATATHVLNFGAFLTEHKYFEEAFSAYERGVEMFAFPHKAAKTIWKAYIEAFLKRYKGSKVERARDLFQRCVDACPPEDGVSEFFMMSGGFEEEYGLTKRALNVYSDMCKKVPAEEKFTAYQLYIAKTTKYLGLTATRDIYQEAIEVLQDTPAAKLCQDFAKMETSLQEIARARAVLTYGSQMADPRINPEYWKSWNEFEVSYGNEETFREMLRIKRSVEAAFSTVNYNAADMSAASKVGNLTNEEAMSMIASREGVEVQEQGKSTISGFVKGKRVAEVANLDQVEERVAKLRKATGAAEAAQSSAAATENNNGGGGDDEEIDIDDVEDEEEEDGEEEKAEENEKEATDCPSKPFKGITTKAVPAAVFCGLVPEGDSKEGGSSKQGALERLRAAAASKK